MDNIDEYELIPQKDLEALRKEISEIKKRPFGENVREQTLIDSLDRLEYSINRLVTILEDANKDIVEEYQNSKPVEKLNQLLDQSETIANALLNINESVKKTQEKVDSLQKAVNTVTEKTQAQATTVMPNYPSANQGLNPINQNFNSDIQRPSMNAALPNNPAPINQPGNLSQFNQSRAFPQQPSPMNQFNPNAAQVNTINNPSNRPQQNITRGNEMPGVVSQNQKSASQDPLPPLDSLSDPLQFNDLPPLDDSNLNDVPKPPERKKILGFI